MENIVIRKKNWFSESGKLFLSSFAGSVVIWLFLFIMVAALDSHYSILFIGFLGFFVSSIVCFISATIYRKKGNLDFAIRMLTFSILCSLCSLIIEGSWVYYLQTAVGLNLMRHAGGPFILLSVLIAGAIWVVSCEVLLSSDIPNNFAKWENVIITVIAFFAAGLSFYIAYLFFTGYYFFFGSSLPLSFILLR